SKQVQLLGIGLQLHVEISPCPGVPRGRAPREAEGRYTTGAAGEVRACTRPVTAAMAAAGNSGAAAGLGEARPQQRGEEPAGVALRHGGDLLRRAGGDDPAALVAALRADVDD